MARCSQAGSRDPRSARRSRRSPRPLPDATPRGRAKRSSRSCRAGAAAHAAADPRLPALRPEPAAVGVQPKKERTLQRKRGGNRIAVEAECIVGGVGRSDLALVAEPELKELDGIGILMTEASSELG